MRELVEIIKKNRNTKLYLIFSFLQSSWFIEAAWYFYWGHFLTYTQIGLFLTWLAVLGLIAEIPTGVFADKFGRKKTVLFGSLLLTIGGIIMTSAFNGLSLIIGASLMTTGRAFNSGALEALVYDSLQEQGIESYWDKLLSKKIQLSLIAYMIAVPIGGYFYSLNFRLPNLLEAITWVLILITAWQLSDKKIENEIKNDAPNINELIIGFRELMKERLRPFILPAFMVVTIYELYDWGLSKPAMAASFGLDSKGQAIAYTLLSIINVLIVGIVPFIRRKLNDYWGIRILNLVSGVAFIISSMIFNLWGIATMFAIEAVGHLGEPWVSSVINKQTDSKYRATTLSTLSFMAMAPHVLVNIFAGLAIDRSGIGKFHLILGIIIVAVTALTINLKKASYPIYQTKNPA